MDFPFTGFRYYFFIAGVVWLVSLIVNVLFAAGVYSDATSIKKPILLVPPAVWGIATLFGGVFVAGVYWVIHHSTLSRIEEEVEPHSLPSVLDEVTD